jgi:hypothetical protein
MALVAVAVAALTLAYYLAVSLPSYNRARLALERQRFVDEQKERERVAKDTSDRERAREFSLQRCLSDADEKRISYLKLNGTVTPKGTIQNDERMVRIADEQKKSDIDICFRRFGPPAHD